MKKRYAILFSDCILLIFLGLIYAWSVFKKPLAAQYGWDDGQLTWTFTICMFMFCLGGFTAAELSKKLSHKVITWGCGALIAASFILMGFMTSLWQIYALYGVVIGFTVGMVYNCVLSTGNKWFPDKGGFIAGLLLMFFGAGSLFLSPLSNALIASLGLKVAFIIIGLLFLAIFIAGGFQVKVPTSDVELPKPVANENGVTPPDFAPKDMIKTRNFILFFIWCIMVSSIGMALLGQIATISGSVGMSDARCALMVSLFAVFNGIGRFVFGSFYDKKGRLLTMTIFGVLFTIGGISLFFGVRSSSIALVVVALSLFGIAYGGVTPTNANFARSYYGNKNYATNFSLVNFNLLVAVFLGQYVGSTLYMQSGGYEATAIALTVLSVLSLAIQFFITKPQAE